MSDWREEARAEFTNILGKVETIPPDPFGPQVWFYRGQPYWPPTDAYGRDPGCGAGHAVTRKVDA